MAEQQKLDELRQRALKLYDSLCMDPERPYWQIELTAIVFGLSDSIMVLTSDAAASGMDLNAVQHSLTSLETRYSELLYRMKDRS